ncbi:hypothetical protein SKAU_G00058320 [Synaphobranchus kaupii]|uniref:Uncharacterized protein n=1 Tax=Synaphobranchus kaupii TaxID=118154 RepID=A0A9Q1G5F0_SYNKA|nr:hypothetical protein SKAU_G00058320 [Synaphobranchus kaupii]
MDELRRILGGTNGKYIEETKARWEDFCAKVQFYGVWKKALKPPFSLSVRGVDSTIALLTALPSLLPSPNPPPKRLGNASEALLHILQVKERISACLTDISEWMATHHLKLNLDKTELLFMPYKTSPLHDLSITVDGTVPREDPSMYLEKQPLSSPVLLFQGTACILAVGNIPPYLDYGPGQCPGASDCQGASKPQAARCVAQDFRRKLKARALSVHSAS